MKALTAFDDYRSMLADTVRMDAYRTAIAAAVRPGDVVIDLGAGTGILGFLALRAGAKRVHLIEKSDAIELARAVAEHNGWADRVVLHRASSFDVTLAERADVLVSETLGSFGIDENTLPATFDVRERLLKPGARLVPQGLELWLAPSDSESVHQGRDLFWRDVAGVDYSPAAELLKGKLGIADVSEAELMANAACVARLDLRTFSGSALELTHRFVFHRPGTVRGLAGWFRADLGARAHIDTSPACESTHWKQAWLPFLQHVAVGQTDILDLALHVAPSTERMDDTVLRWDWFCSQIELPEHRRRSIPCPCGSGSAAGRCCALARPLQRGSRGNG